MMHGTIVRFLQFNSEEEPVALQIWICSAISGIAWRREYSADLTNHLTEDFLKHLHSYLARHQHRHIDRNVESDIHPVRHHRVSPR